MPHKKSLLTSPPSGVITAMFTDIVNSTRIKGMMEGDTSMRRDTEYRQHIKEPHDAVVLTYAAEAGGYLVNPTGDGFCITFVDAEEAVLCALKIQQHLEKSPIGTPLGALQLRIGLHTGMAGAVGDDYIASTIDKTARIQSQSGAGQVFVSHQTQVLVSDKTQGVKFEPRGIFDLKGLQSEELYQAMPLPNLDLSEVASDAHTLNDDRHSRPYHSGSHAPSQGGALQQNRPAKRLLKVAAVLGGLLLAAGVGFNAWKGSSVGKVVLPAGSHWDGSFHFLPPMSAYDGSVSIKVQERKNDTFSAIYSTENNSYQWLIEGKVQGKNIRWEFVKPIKNPGNEDATGKAYGEATVEGDVMKGFFRMKNNPGEVASLDLRAAEK